MSMAVRGLQWTGVCQDNRFGFAACPSAVFNRTRYLIPSFTSGLLGPGLGVGNTTRLGPQTLRLETHESIAHVLVRRLVAIILRNISGLKQ
tara:strand:+ start:155 stop:427 length:273 start_codon:yes stop_codon:yes gene_type:complete